MITRCEVLQTSIEKESFNRTVVMSSGQLPDSCLSGDFIRSNSAENIESAKSDLCDIRSLICIWQP